MPIWALLEDGREVAAYRAWTHAIAREDCETEARERGLAVDTAKGLALLPGVEIVCYQDD